MSVTKLSAESFEDVVQNGDLPVVVDFYADWCGPCRHLAPVIDSLSKIYEGRALFAKVNVDDEQELAARYQVRSIPTVILFEDGRPRGRTAGVKSPQALADELGLGRKDNGNASGCDTNDGRVGGLRSR